MWYTPAHILGGWRSKLRERKQADVMRELLALDRSAAVSDAEDDRASAGDIMVDAAVAVESAVEVAVVAGEDAGDTLCDLFDAAVEQSNIGIFEAVDQLALF
ncbi:hypothetical protein KDW88_27195 [Burkholderia cenocepacia]|nr:hypothetical protein [Burkholderia cenocepacia]MBR8270470.1 hypothetical protein [Burkholderia cenocepacia]